MSPFFGTSPSAQQGYIFAVGELAVAPPPAYAATLNPAVDAMKSFLAGGTPTNDVDLAVRLQAAAPDTYED
jgi:hypothetical protein